MSETQTTNGSRRPLIILAIGDIISLILFALIGRQSHAEALTLQSVFMTAAPFVVAWFIMATVLRAYRPGLLTSPRAMFMQSLVVAIGAGALGVFLRAMLLRVPVNQTFLLVAIPMVVLFVIAWRMIFIFVYQRSHAVTVPAGAAAKAQKKQP